jgi:hypothetical protein
VQHRIGKKAEVASSVPRGTPDVKRFCRNPDVREFPVADEIVLVLPPSGTIVHAADVSNRAVTLNKTGRAIWELCDGNRCVRETAKILAKQYAADPKILTQDILDTAGNLAQLGFLDDLTKPTEVAQVMTFVIGTEDKPYFRWQVALFLESFRNKLPAGWKTIVAVCNNGEPLSAELKHILESYNAPYIEARNYAKFPLDVASEVGSHHGAFNRIEALSLAATHVRDDDILCLLDNDTFLYGNLNFDVLPRGCAVPRNWHIDQEKFFSSVPVNNGKGVDLRKLLEAIGCKADFKPGGVNVFVTGKVARNEKFIADCFRFAQVLFLLGRITGVEKCWIAEMPCFALAMTANGIHYDLLTHQEFLVPSCDERSIPPGTIYHYYCDPADFGRAAFAGSKWHKQAYRESNFLRSDYRPFLEAARSKNATDHERYFFDLAEKARRRIYLHKTPAHLIEPPRKREETIPLLGLGFLKTRIDKKIHERLLQHFRSNIHNFKSEPGGDYLLTENESAYPSLLYLDETFNQELLEEFKALHERWSGCTLRKAACYGIRVYQPGSYLYSHVDRLTHVVSSTICVDHRLRNRWPLYVEDADGRPHEIEIEPGEMVFFEGARLKHGRPYALNGEYYANVFLHYTPADLPVDARGGVSVNPY